MKALAEQINELDVVEVYGRVVGVRGLMVEVAGPIEAMPVGARVNIETQGEPIACEVVGFTGSNALLMPFAALEGVRRGCRAVVAATAAVRPSFGWLGRVVDAMGQPIDGKGPLPPGPSPYPFRNQPPPAHARRRMGEPLDLGVRAINTFITCCRGQRMGIFSASGVGKSTLLGMLARNVRADVSVVGLIGERGREVQEFLQDDLGPEGLARSVVVVATSNEPPLMRRQAAYLTLAIAEYFRDEGKDVLLLMDSITRFAVAQREIGLSVGEPPTAKGFTPTVFSELPRLLERAGTGTNEGTITAMFSVLVEGDDHNEPISDAVRAILDGHIVLERAIAERGRYPAINVLRSVSRSMPRSADPAYLDVLARARQVMATYADMEELIRLGAYRPGSSPEVDEAIRLHRPLEAFLAQGKEESTSMAEGYRRLEQILKSPAGPETEN
ncbi:MAG TPA: flagellar protein export ATPase FliI [Xanthobacteraceae bacterium]|nr:flagellar protein export ATPase FliI [Xanthobacteraceae bacterium]